MTGELELNPREEFELDQRRAKAYAESGYWDKVSFAQALVKVEAGRALGLPPLIAMNEVHVIDGAPGLGAGACAALVKASGRYDYRLVELTDQRCVIRFYDRGVVLQPDSVFTIEHAKQAKLLNKGNWLSYPRNMLFARAMTNGMAWHCPDVAMGRVYVPDELGADLPEHVPYDEDPTIPFGDDYHEPGVDQGITVEAEIVEQLEEMSEK